MYRPIHHLIAAIVSLYRYFRPLRSNAPAYFTEAPPMFVHGNSKRVAKSVIKFRRWRKMRMRMQRESRRINRAA